MIDPGSRLGRYEIRSQLGAGGMGEVYLAEDTQLGRRVAIKLLPTEIVSDEQARKRLVREARAAAALDHPHICSIYEVGEADGRNFIVMQYVEGETLDTRMKRKPLEMKESVTIASQVAAALSEAHAHGIIHRDIKPQNIMINSRGQAKVMDFGLAISSRPESDDPYLLAAIGDAYARLGKRAEARKIIEELKDPSKQRYVPTFFIAIIYIELEEKEQALEWLEKSYENRDDAMIWLNSSPLLDDLRSEPRFQDLVRRVGLSQ